MRRRDVESSLEASIATLGNALQFIRAKDLGDRDEKLLLHRPRVVEPRQGEALHEVRPLPTAGFGG